MRFIIRKNKQAKYENYNLYLKVNDEVQLLGNINTRNGGLTRIQKLKAVAGQGEWVKI